jgi:hypothetical protein
MDESACAGCASKNEATAVQMENLTREGKRTKYGENTVPNPTKVPPDPRARKRGDRRRSSMKFLSSTLPALLLSYGCALHGKAPETYRTPINKAAFLEKNKYADVVKRNLEGSTWNWRKTPSYREVREKALESGLRPQILLEIGNENRGSYETIWLGPSRNGALALFRLGAKSSVLLQPLDDATLRTVYEKALTLSLDFETCKSALSFSDASAYFGTVETEEGPRQFAVYGLNFFPSANEEQEQEALAMAPCKDFVSLILQAIDRSPTPTLIGEPPPGLSKFSPGTGL